MVNTGELVLHALRGDRRALEALLQRYQRPMLNFLYRLCSRKQALAEDLMQDVFLRVVAHFDRFNPGLLPAAEGAEESAEARAGRAFEKWLFTIARNRMRDHWRSVRPEVPLDDESHALPSNEPDPSWQIDLREQGRALEDAIDELPYVQREVLTLRMQGGLTFAEISEVMGAPLGTSLARMRYALLALRKRLESTE